MPNLLRRGGHDCVSSGSLNPTVNAGNNDYSSSGPIQIKGAEIIFTNPPRPVSQFTLSVSGNDITVTRPNDFQGCLTVRYIPYNNSCEGVQTYQQYCFYDGSLCTPTPPPLSCAVPTENCPELVCDGGFEGFNYRKLEQHSDYNTVSSNTTDLYGFNNGNWVFFAPNGTTWHNIVKLGPCAGNIRVPVPPAYEGNRYIGMEGVLHNSEGIYFQLMKKLEVNGKYKISIYVKNFYYPCSASINFSLSRMKPCSPAICNSGALIGNSLNPNRLKDTVLCGNAFIPGSQLSFDVSSFSDWQKVEHEICITDEKDINAEYLIIYAGWEHPYNTYVLLDAVSLRPVQPEANILPVGSSCRDSVVLDLDRNLGCNYRYSWSPSAGLSCHPNCDTLTAPRVKAKPGGRTQYLLTIKNTSDCFTTRTIIVADSSPFVSSRAVNPIACTGTTSFISDISEGTAPFTYLWSPATYLNNPTLRNPVFTFIPPYRDTTLTYTLTVTDVNGCTAADTVKVRILRGTVPQPEILTPPSAYCGGQSLTLAATTNNPDSLNLLYQWTPCPPLTDCSRLTLPNVTQTGDYIFRVTDISGSCSASDTVRITAGPPIQIVSPLVRPVSCFGGSDGRIDFNVLVAFPYDYRWSDNDMINSSSRNNLRAGSYTVTIIDRASGCRKDTTFTVTEPSAVNTTLVLAVNPRCDVLGKIRTQTAGGNPPYTYEWTLDNNFFPGNRDSLVGLTNGGTYRLIVTDARGCKDTLTQTLTPGGTPIEPTLALTHVTCNGNGRIRITLQGAVPFIN